MERKKKSQLLQPPPPPSTTTKITFSPQIIPSMGEQTQTKPHYTPPPPPQPSTLPLQSLKPPHHSALEISNSNFPQTLTITTTIETKTPKPKSNKLKTT